MSRISDFDLLDELSIRELMNELKSQEKKAENGDISAIKYLAEEFGKDATKSFTTSQKCFKWVTKMLDLDFKPAKYLSKEIVERNSMYLSNFDYRLISNYYKRAIAAGDVEEMFEYGNLMKRDYLKYYRMAANAGHVEAMIKYAELTKNKKKATRLYAKAAAAGNLKAIFELTKRHLPDNEEKAFENLKKFSDSEAMAAYRMAQIYNFTQFVDIQKALQWYEKAAALGDLSHTKYFESNYKVLRYIWDKIKDDPELQENFKKAAKASNSNIEAMRGMNFYSKDKTKGVEWLKRAAVDFGDKIAMNSLALHFDSIDPLESLKWLRKYFDGDESAALERLGDYVEDEEERLKWYGEAAKLDNSEALYEMGLIYYPDINENDDDDDDDENEIKSQNKLKFKDVTKAIECFKRASELGYLLANYRLAGIYIVEYSDETEALNWCQKYAEGDEAEAMYFVGRIYLDCSEISQNEQKAMEWLEKAAQNGSCSAKELLAVFYYYGCLVDEDDEKAVKLMQEANNFDYSDAEDCLRKMYEERSRDNLAVKWICRSYNWITGKSFDCSWF